MKELRSLKHLFNHCYDFHFFFIRHAKLVVTSSAKFTFEDIIFESIYKITFYTNFTNKSLVFFSQTTWFEAIQVDRKVSLNFYREYQLSTLILCGHRLNKDFSKIHKSFQLLKWSLINKKRISKLFFPIHNLSSNLSKEKRVCQLFRMTRNV